MARSTSASEMYEIFRKFELVQSELFGGGTDGDEL